MREIEKISSALFDKVRSRFDNVNIGDENAKATTDPEKARFFNFDYVDANGTNFGNVTISVIDENSLKIYFGKNITTELTDEQREEWFNFLRSLRKFAKRNLLSFDTRDIGRSNLDIRNLKQQSKSDSTYDSSEINVSESKLYGSRHRSYQECGPSKILIKHSTAVDEEKRGSRTRNIECIYVETHEGERFKMPYNNLHYARAIGQHCSQGGKPIDPRAKHITGMMKEMASMSHFVRSMHHRQFEDAETIGMVEAASHRYNSLKKTLKSLRGPRGYNAYFSNWQQPSIDSKDDIDLDGLKERFTKKIFDDRLSEALPYVYRAFQEHQTNSKINGSEQFESWANGITEGTWAIPDSDDKIAQLQDLISKPLAIGVDGEDATNALYDIIGDDGLFDQIDIRAENEGPEYDARPLIKSWLERNMPEVLSRLDWPEETPEPAPALTPAANKPTPQSPAVPPVPTGATTMDEPNVGESADPLSFIRKLAGL